MERNHKHKIDYGIRDLYKFYKKHCKNPVNYNMYKNFLLELNFEIVKLIVLKNIEFTLPCRLGSIYILKKKSKVRLDAEGNLVRHTLPIDYKQTKELWNKLYPDKTLKEIKEISNRTYVYHKNKHTDGYTMSFKYFKKTSNIKNKSVYTFLVTREAKRFLNTALKSPNLNLNYYEACSY